MDGSRVARATSAFIAALTCGAVATVLVVVGALLPVDAADWRNPLFGAAGGALLGIPIGIHVAWADAGRSATRPGYAVAVLLVAARAVVEGALLVATVMMIRSTSLELDLSGTTIDRLPAAVLGPILGAVVGVVLLACIGLAVFGLPALAVVMPIVAIWLAILRASVRGRPTVAAR